mmetsp:Transcript_384/g.597  ORF Transcript_384/g.597 Transcript_384/m.597 type:complete len:364 (+) Transcript_384:79-1170(+)
MICDSCREANGECVCTASSSSFGRCFSMSSISCSSCGRNNNGSGIIVNTLTPRRTAPTILRFEDFFVIACAKTQRQLACALFVLLLLSSRIEMAKADGIDHGEGTESQEEEQIIEDALITEIIAYCSIGLLLSAITAIMGVVSFKEDELIQRYCREGVVVTAELKGVSYARGNESNKEFTASADYLRDLTKHYRIRIRKQIKVKAESIQQADNTVLMYVIPTLPKSGQVKDTVDRNAAWSYRASTVGLLCFTMVFAMVCFFEPAVKALRSNEIEDDQRKHIEIIVGSAAGVGIGLWPFAYFTTGAFFEGMLREEYFETGDMLSADNDDSTISTYGSDPQTSQSPEDVRRKRSSSIESYLPKVV